MTDQAERAFRLLIPDHLDSRSAHEHVGLIGGLFDELDVGLVSVDAARDFAHVNRTAAALLRIPTGPTTASEFWAVILDLTTRALNHAEAAALIRSVSGGGSAEFKSTWSFADAPMHMGVVSKPAPYPGFDGRIWAFYDNSPVAEAISAASEAGALIRASSDAMLDPQVVLESAARDGDDPELIYRDVNDAACSYFGLSREQMVGHPLLDSALKDRYVNCAQTGEPVILDAFAFHSEMLGAVRYYDIRATQVRPGLLTLTWRDVTERIETAQRVAASEEQFRLLAENVADVVVRLNDDGLVTWASNSIAAAMGAPAPHWIGQHVTELYPPEKRAHARQRWAQIVDAGTYIGRAGVLGADGTPHSIHVHSKPFFDADGERDGLVASFRVIDDEVAAETQAREQIEHRDARNRSLARYLQAQTNRLMSQLHSAARYVESILPSDLDGPVAVTARCLPSEELGGDSYDFRWVDDDHLIVYLVDVSGHGVEPALLSVSVHNVLRSGTIEPRKLLEPGAVLTELNRLFQTDRQDGHFFTIWYGVYQASTRTMRYASAGHPPALSIAEDAALEYLSTNSVPVGVDEDADFETRSYAVPPGCDIVIYSDGAFELDLHDDQRWSMAEFGEACARIAQKPDWTLDMLVADLQQRSASGLFEDDCTLVRLHFPS